MLVEGVGFWGRGGISLNLDLITFFNGNNTKDV
jgi:hypothetical protein